MKAGTASSTFFYYGNSFQTLKKDALELTGKDYHEFDSPINKILDVEKQLTGVDGGQLEAIMNNLRHAVCHDTCQELLNKIEQRKTRGELFSQIKKRINEIQEEINGQPRPTKEIYINLMRELRYLKEATNEKISNEKFRKKQLLIGLGAGFILGLIASVLVGIFL